MKVYTRSLPDSELNVKCAVRWTSLVILHREPLKPESCINTQINNQNSELSEEEWYSPAGYGHIDNFNLINVDQRLLLP